MHDGSTDAVNADFLVLKHEILIDSAKYAQAAALELTSYYQRSIIEGIESKGKEFKPWLY